MDSFEHRLQQFLEMENISQAQFANTLGIQRGGLCHLLSGRNKPSYDFIIKLISSFPTLNSEWMLTGRGKPYKQTESFIEPAQPSPKDLFPPEDIPAEIIEPSFCTDEESAQFAATQGINQSETVSQPILETISDKRTVERIIIFYSDGTFEER